MSESTESNEQFDGLDVRVIPPAQRHPMIFQRFAALPEGGSFVLINDHDPKPLYYQLTFEYNGEPAWDYLEQGPQVWRVRSGRTAPMGRRRYVALHPMTKEAE